MLRILASAAFTGVIILSAPSQVSASAYDLLNGTFNLTPGELFTESIYLRDEWRHVHGHANTPCAYHHEPVHEEPRRVTWVTGGKPVSELTIDPDIGHEFISFKGEYLRRYRSFINNSPRRYHGNYGQCVLNDGQRFAAYGVTDERDPRFVNRQWQRRQRTYFTGYSYGYSGGHHGTYGCGCGRPWVRNASEDILRHRSLNNGGRGGSGGGGGGGVFAGAFSGSAKPSAAAAPSPAIKTAMSLEALPQVSGTSPGLPEFASVSTRSAAASASLPVSQPPAVPLPASWLFLASALSLFAFGGWKPRV